MTFNTEARNHEVDLALAVDLAINNGTNLAAALGDLPSQLRPYDANSGDKLIDGFMASTPAKHLRFIVETDSCNQAGVNRGDIVELDDSAEGMASIEAGSVVAVRTFSSDVIFVRQFVPPGLLTTNSSRENPPPIQMVQSGVWIAGVIWPVASRASASRDWAAPSAVEVPIAAHRQMVAGN
ncbi:MAG: hypothetical protein JSR99_08200 [Proteobacteria bacterium]|nr:hypothetical protein [Pseudomonadota bacterium]